MNDETLKALGRLVPLGMKRDAVHIAVVPLVAAESLAVGARVGIRAEDGLASKAVRTIGVVDPYLREQVNQGERFWLFLDPGSITSLRHDWTHPDVPGGDGLPMGASERWIREYANTIPLDYEVLMSGADTWVHTSARSQWGGDYLTLGGLLEGYYVPDEFWPHYEAVRGKSVPEEYRQSFFSCSC